MKSAVRLMPSTEASLFDRCDFEGVAALEVGGKQALSVIYRFNAI